MFDQSYECPMNKTKKDQQNTTCKGCREDGILKNVCAAKCNAYKNYVKAKYDA